MFDLLVHSASAVFRKAKEDKGGRSAEFLEEYWT